MPRYTREVGDLLFAFGEDVHVGDDFATTADPSTNGEDWSTVARLDIEKGVAKALGRGETTNPLSAEGFLYFDAVDDGGTAMQGKMRFVVQNPQNETVAEISRHDLDNLRSGSPAASDRRDRTPYPRQRIRNGKAEVGEPYKIGIQIRESASYSGSSTFSLSNSTLLADGYTGTQQG